MVQIYKKTMKKINISTLCTCCSLAIKAVGFYILLICGQTHAWVISPLKAVDSAPQPSVCLMIRGLCLSPRYRQSHFHDEQLLGDGMQKGQPGRRPYQLR